MVTLEQVVPHAIAGDRGAFGRPHDVGEHGTNVDVGSNLAITPGAVVCRSELLELIEYRAQTQQVHGTPLFIVNKFCIWDLAPGRSLIEYLVQQGFQVFVASWFNPDAGQSEWGLETCVQALVQAMDVTREIADTQQLHVAGRLLGRHHRGGAARLPCGPGQGLGAQPDLDGVDPRHRGHRRQLHGPVCAPRDAGTRAHGQRQQ
uniref:hypothetical protein n=1 Tax=Variovorax brevis TaxID=3053503 RepID=UPI0033654747